MDGIGDRLRRDLEEIALYSDEIPDSAALRSGADELAGRFLPADDTFWCEIDLGTASAAVRRDGRLDEQLAAAVGSNAFDHPGILSYLTEPAGLRPRRVSDVSSDPAWLATHAWRDAFREHGGRYQLSLVVALEPSSKGAGWIVTRQRRDFHDDELSAARRIHPLLRMAFRMAAMRSIADEGTADGGARATPLTPREMDVLQMLARGYTADAIGRMRAISPGTVRKHLEHVYQKLGVHDRLLVVDRARGLGLLPPGPESPVVLARSTATSRVGRP